LWAGYTASLLLAFNLPFTILLAGALQYALVARAGPKNGSAAVQYLIWIVSHLTVTSFTYPFSVLRARAQASEQTTRDELQPEKLPAAHPRIVREAFEIEALQPGFLAETLRILLKDGATAVLGKLTHASLYQSHCFFSSLFERSRKIDEIISQHASASGQTGLSTAGPSQEWGSTNETAELVGDYVEDEAEDWRSFYHWFWDPERRRDGH
jgi:hypothetical protein